MRLSTTELDALRSIIGVLDPQGRIYLFGSRVDDARRGGDIDVYLEASRPIALKERLAAQYRLSAACNAHVDLLVKAPDQPEQAIHHIAVEQGILLSGGVVGPAGATKPRHGRSPVRRSVL